MNRGAILKALRSEREITDEELCEQTGIELVVYRKLEEDKTSINIEQLKTLCNYYEISPNELLGENDDMDENSFFELDLTSKERKEIEKIIDIMDEIDFLKGKIK